MHDDLQTNWLQDGVGQCGPIYLKSFDTNSYGHQYKVQQADNFAGLHSDKRDGCRVQAPVSARGVKSVQHLYGGDVLTGI